MSAPWDFRSSLQDTDQSPAEIDSSVAHSARVYDFILGGKDNFEADREAAAKALAAFPPLAVAMRENRAMMRRAVTFLARAGITQFLDLGTGIPTSPNVHEVAQAVHPAARVMYTDNDPIVLAHARALLRGRPEGRTAYVDADVRRPGLILAAARETLDFTRPVAILAFGILMFLPDRDDPYGVLAELVGACPAGSYLALTHPSAELHPPGAAAGVAGSYERSGIPFQFRSAEQIATFFDGLSVVEPGIVPMSQWRPDPDHPAPADASAAGAYGGVGIKG